MTRATPEHGDSHDILGVRLEHASGAEDARHVQRSHPRYIEHPLEREMTEKIAIAVRLKQPLYMEGGTSLGKSTTVRQVVSALGYEYHALNCHSGTSNADLMGKYGPNVFRKDPDRDPEFIFVDGIITSAIRAAMGGAKVCLFLDEINFAKAGVLGRIHNIIDAYETSDEFTLAEDANERLRIVRDNLVIIAAGNPPGREYKGREPIDPAQIRRWTYHKLSDRLPKESLRTIAWAKCGRTIATEAPTLLNVSSRQTDVGIDAISDLPGYESIFERYLVFHRGAQEALAAGQIAVDQPQHFTFDDQMETTRVIEFVRAFYQGDLTKTFRQALEYYYVAKLETEEDRKKLRELLLHVRADAPKPDARRKGPIKKNPEGSAEVAAIFAAPEASVETRIEGALSLAQLSDWLTEQGLDTKLATSLDVAVRTYEAAYSDGKMGFRLDRRALLFPKDPASLAALRAAIEAKSVNGVIITAYPTATEVKEIATRAGLDEAALLAMPITEFQARHFLARNGVLYKDEERIAEWKEMRWEPREEGREFNEIYRTAPNHAAAHEALKDQPRLADVLGHTLLTFTDTTPNPDDKTKILQDAAPGSPAHITRQGATLTLPALAAAGAHIQTPEDHLALLAVADPKVRASYPDYVKNWTRLSGIDASRAAFAHSGSDGAFLFRNALEHAHGFTRVRSALRGTPGVGLDLDATSETPGALDPSAAREAIATSPGLAAFQAALQKAGLESTLDAVDGARTLEAHLQRALRALSDPAGDLAFIPDLSKLTFPTDVKTLARLKEGLESGAMNGIVLTAYPTEADLPRLLTAINAQERKRSETARVAGETYEPRTFTLELLKAMPVTEFLARHFEARGGTLYERDARIKNWAELRWPTDGTLLHFALAANGGDLAKTHTKLPPQQTLGRVLGTAALTVTNVTQEVAVTTLILQKTPTEGKESLAQGDACTFTAAMAAETNPLTPTEWLTLLGQIADPTDTSTYPNPNWQTWEWLAGITPSRAANANSASVGALLFRNDLGRTDGSARVRSALRGTPG